MHRRLLYAIATVVAALGMFTVAASASGPLAPGKTVITFTCTTPTGDYFGTFLVTEPHAFFHAVGLGQVVGEQLHGIPVNGTTVIQDHTTPSNSIELPFVTGNGNAHPYKPTINCIGTAFAGVASDFFGTSLPSGLPATDTITVIDIINVILKP